MAKLIIGNAGMGKNISRYHVSDQFESFLMERMSGPEFDFFQMRIGPLSLYPASNGSFAEDFQAKGSSRTIRFSYYFSEKLKRLFVLGAHLLRRGEPTDYDQNKMSAFLEAVKAWEMNPTNVPDAFKDEDEKE
jgi:hypothetical protein